LANALIPVMALPRMRLWTSWRQYASIVTVTHMGALIRVADLEVGLVATDAILIRAGVSAKDVQQHARMGKRVAAVVALHHRDHVRVPLALVLLVSKVKRSKQTEGCGRAGVDKLLLDELERGEGAVELVAVV
jgi:hypothetical protein